MIDDVMYIQKQVEGSLGRPIRPLAFNVVHARGSRNNDITVAMIVYDATPGARLGEKHDIRVNTFIKSERGIQCMGLIA